MHNITDRDGLFVVREPAWHGLGVVLDDYPTREQAQALAHPWEPVQEPVYRKVLRVEKRLHQHGQGRCIEQTKGTNDCVMYEGDPNFMDEVPTESFEEVEDAKLQVRSDGQGTLGVVSATYTPVTNGEMYDIAEVIEGQDKDAVMYETAGSLLGGRKVWLLLRLKDPIKIAGDPRGDMVPYYALQNSHDGSGSFRGQATLTRIVCDNTAKAADFDAAQRGTEFVFSHTKNIGQRVEEAKKALAGWRDSVTNYVDQSQYLLSLGIDVRRRELFLSKFIPAPSDKVVSDRVMANIEEGRAAVRTILAGTTCEGINYTAYGLVQASVEYLNHVRKAHSAESRFRRAYLDRSELVAHAVNLAQEAARA
jgi:phage/plasmid-like protein (TIGR03299 family)